MTAPAPSILMYVGEDNYSLAAFIDEAEDIGVSKRIPVKSIPQGLVPAVSKIFLAHAKAIVKVTKEGYSLHDLAYALLEAGVLTGVQWNELIELDLPYWTGAELEPFDPVPANMLDIAYAFSILDRQAQAEMIDAFGLEFHPGIFGFSHLSGLEYVLPPDIEELPADADDNLRFAIESGYVTPVHVRYDYDEE